jgi:NADPH:quinone reductase-like Zn-dependent oxidoreductase
MFRLGQYVESFPARLGYKAAGTVETVGKGVQGFRPGDISDRRMTGRRGTVRKVYARSTKGTRGREAEAHRRRV